jgi:hypothetical protein
MYTDGEPVSASVELAMALRDRLSTFVAPLLRELDYRLDARLVRTFAGAIEAILSLRNRSLGLLLSELGGFLLSPEHAPAGTKRLSNLLRSDKWGDKHVKRFLWQGADTRLKELEAGGEEALALWDQSVLEKPESLEAEGLCAVRSSRAARLRRIKPGFYNPPGGRPVFVPGFEWLGVMLCGLSQKSGPAIMALMHWWTRRGEHATDARSVQVQVLLLCRKAWGRRVLHVFDRGYAGFAWLSVLLFQQARFVVRWPKHYKLQARKLDGPPAQRRGEEQPAWELARGKKRWGEKRVYDTHTKERRTIRVVALPVFHPQGMTPLWLVVASAGEGREPWYLLTSETVETEEQAWRIYFTYHRRWQVEMCFRYNKSELGMESPRLGKWQNRMKLLSMVALVYAFLVSLLRPELHALAEELLRRFCHRTGQRNKRSNGERGRETSAPLYRIRAAISRLLMSHPKPPLLNERLSPQSSG